MRCNEITKARGRFISDPGSPIHTILEPHILEDGQLDLVEIGKEDTDEIIQSYYESTTLEVILSKYAQGDLSALNRYEPIYMDVTTQPKNLAEAQQKIINSKNAFEALPTEIKAQFGNDFNRWIASAGTEEWFGFMSPVFPVNNNINEGVATERSEDSKPSEKE